MDPRLPMSRKDPYDWLVKIPALFSCIMLGLYTVLPEEDIQKPKDYEMRWLYYTNSSCELKPNGYFQYLRDGDLFWMHIEGAMENWRDRIRDENPFEQCNLDFEGSAETKLRCRARIQEVIDRWNRCYPIVRLKRKETCKQCIK